MVSVAAVRRGRLEPESDHRMDNLTNEQRDMVLRFLLYRMPLDTRHALMRSLPLAYVALHPETEAVVIAMVRDALA